MSKGRKPDPKAARRGTSRNRKKTDIAPVEFSGAFPVEAAVNIPAPPSIPEPAHDLWRGICAEIARHELRPGDLPLVESYVLACWRQRQCGEYITQNGIVVETPFGPVKNPMVAEERMQSRLKVQLQATLGLSPEARIRLDLMQIAGQSLLATLKAELDGDA